MATEHACKLADIIRDAGIEDAHAEGLEKLIEEIETAAWERGKEAGASPYDGTWPAAS